jgi:hypothetical protein
MKRIVPLLRTAAVAAVVLSVDGIAMPAAPPGRYAVSGGTVLDGRTKLTWQQVPNASALAWSDAKNYCGGLTLGGLTWRLPTLKELATLVDVSAASPPTIDTNVFPNTPVGLTWSLTPSVDTPGSTWGLDFGTGTAAVALPTELHIVRCVR